MHDDVIIWKHFPRNWPFVRGILRSREFPTQRPVTWSFDVFFDLRLNKNGWVNNCEAGDLRRHRGHYDVSVMLSFDRWGCPVKPRSTMPLLRHSHVATYTVTMCVAAATQKQIQLPSSQRTVTLQQSIANAIFCPSHTVTFWPLRRATLRNVVRCGYDVAAT